MRQVSDTKAVVGKLRKDERSMALIHESGESFLDIDDLECVSDCVCVGRILVSILDPLEEMSYVISLLLDLIVTTKIQKTNKTQ